ncbi:MAG TPA: YaiO family outer membrane beta-barrel protein [Planctomycetota bacterium]|nr:YaiO family outer membrane beta-barrel protein [Planctomycetota bacterium]
MKDAACLIILLTIYAGLGFADETGPNGLSKEPPTAEPVKNTDKLTLGINYEYGMLKHGQWTSLNLSLAYLTDKSLLQTPYLEISEFDRLDKKDYTIELGSYYKFKDASGYFGAGLGVDVDYVYKSKISADYTNRLVNNYFGKISAKYLQHDNGDVAIISPGLVYYFGDHYLDADYNVSFTAERGSAGWFKVAGNFAFNETTKCRFGAMAGQRLYDINLANASSQKAYIISAGIDYASSPELNLRLGISFSREEPSFIKRGLDTGLALKF